MICHLFAWSAWAQTANVEAVMTGEGAALSPVRLSAVVLPATVLAGTIRESATLSSGRLVCVGSACHCGSGNDR